MSNDAQPDYRAESKRKPQLMPPGLEAKTDAQADPELKQWIQALWLKLFGSKGGAS